MRYRHHGRSFVVAAIPVVTTLVIFFGRTHLFPIGGDEPHYLVIADSIVSDRDVNLKNNYERDAQTGVIYGPVEPHVYRLPTAWIPYHGAGLPLLTALPFAAGGERAVRVALCVFAGLLPWALMRWLQSLVGTGTAGWLVTGVLLAPPILFGSTQIYPDLPAGVLATALACWLLIRSDRTAEDDVPSRWPWLLFWLAGGYLPWLNLKFAPATLALAAGGLGLVWRWRSEHVREAERRLAAWTLPFVALAPLLLIAFNLSTSGTWIGLRGGAELTHSPGRALMILAGLHVDQSQGMFFAQPLLAAGVAAFVPFAAIRPRLALFWAALYASLIVPNSLELARYGLGGPAGRFAWSAMWLWIVPIGVALAFAGDRLTRCVRAAVLGVLAYQAALAVRWTYIPQVLFTHVDPPRDSPFPDALVPWLPSFYTWDFTGYLRDGANQAAFAVVVLLLAAGWFLVRRTRPC